VNNFQFHAGEPLVLDGGLGTQLEKKGCDVSSRLWSARVLLDRPDMVEQVHSEYLEAGAECITTASYQVSFEGFSKAGLSRKQTVKALQESVHLAQTSRQKFLLKHPRSRPTHNCRFSWTVRGIPGDGSEFHGKLPSQHAGIVYLSQFSLEYSARCWP
jgi:homocysteine S-methyltransferase